MAADVYASTISDVSVIAATLGTAGASGTGDVANLLKSSLSKGEVTCIGATTLAEYYKYIARDEALARRFSNITVEEPSPEETRRILLESQQPERARPRPDR